MFKGRTCSGVAHTRWFLPLDLKDRPGERLFAAAVALAGLAILFLAHQLVPSKTGFGTHQQLGLAPCLVPIVTGYPCPTCGMTTAVAFAADGRWIRSFQAQPAGLMLALCIIFIVFLAGLGAISGNTWRLNPLNFSINRLITMAIAVWLLGWGFKVALGKLGGTLPIW
jgi:hypothetical protein